VSDTAIAFVVGAVLMILAGLVEVFLGVRAERGSLEEIATPLTVREPVHSGPSRSGAARSREPARLKRIPRCGQGRAGAGSLC
jgi:hypothetical protein